jgi:peptidase M48-like protein
MRIALAVQIILLSMLTSDHASAQRYYSFEEACRNAGQTTGACAPKSQQEIYLGCEDLFGNAFHADQFSDKDCKHLTLSPGGDAQILVELFGLQNISKINDLQVTIARSVGINNAVATFAKGRRIIVHDPTWAKTATAEFYLVLGHEAGHHLCGHNRDTSLGRRKEQELEADRFSGASIKRFETYHGKPFLDSALKAAARLYSDDNRSYPRRASRIEAVLLGYNSGSPCGNLAPAIKGFSPQPR